VDAPTGVSAMVSDGAGSTRVLTPESPAAPHATAARAVATTAADPVATRRHHIT
jgi:hypothetical protein